MALDTNPDYWREFTNLQHVKHSLIREYLNGWFPKLGFWSGRVVYLDTHAGRGGHDDGQSGSPIVALKTLLQHRYCSRILDNSEVRFIFIEHDPDNVQALRQHVSALGDLPGRVHVAVSSGDCFLQLERLLSNLATGHKKMEPAFIFVDPYGFTVPGELLSKLLSAGRVELFVNVIWRELDMALAQAQANPRSGRLTRLMSYSVTTDGEASIEVCPLTIEQIAR